jgi:hypothetical protein
MRFELIITQKLEEKGSISHTVLYDFYGFDLANNAKKIHVKK